MKKYLFSLLFLTLLFTTLISPGESIAADDIKMVIGGEEISTTPAPIILNGRTMVPVRFVSEKLGAVIEWYPKDKKVEISKKDCRVLLRIDNRLVDFFAETTTNILIDVPPKLIEGSTYVPLRLVGNALGVKVDWDDVKKRIIIDPQVQVPFTPFFDITFSQLIPGQVISGITPLQYKTNSPLPQGAVEVRYQLLDPQTGKGPVVARGRDLNGVYTWLPDPAHNGQRVLTVAFYDEKGNFLAGNGIGLRLAVVPEVTLKGLTPGQVVEDKVVLKAEANFLAKYVKYEIKNLQSGKVTMTEEMAPQGVYSWTPTTGDNGSTAIRVLAYDSEGNSYPSETITVNIAVKEKVTLRGITSGATVDKPVTLWVAKNFPITQVEYLLRNPQTGEEIQLAQRSYEGFTWFPGPEQGGAWEVLARVKDTSGNYRTTNSIPIQLKGTPQLLLKGIGPNQVITGTVKLKALANVPLTAIEYVIFSPAKGVSKVIAQGNDPQEEYSWTPTEGDEGAWEFEAKGITAEGEKISSEKVPVKVYLGKIYSPVPVADKEEFLDLASQMAVKSQEITGMSAALQTAQAILETGWGQKTPVDKYTGQVSYNIFGIKGKGTAGSITSNTWEEYNGQAFRVDAQFRAYRNVQESWDDHKKLLLNAARYEPYRKVMHNSTLGAWALKETGYATDSKYPLKLMDIIKRYDLHLLDEKGI